jgi:putative SOS response-associated peptidase YedK
MCGRVRLSSDVSEIKLVFSIPPHRPTPNFPPSWNVAPTDQLPVVRHDRKAGERGLDLLRWVPEGVPDRIGVPAKVERTAVGWGRI